MDNNDVALLHGQRLIGGIEVSCGDEFLFLLGDIPDYRIAIVAGQRDFMSEQAALKYVSRRIGMGGAMHDGRYFLGQTAGLGHVVHSLDFYIFKIRPHLLNFFQRPTYYQVVTPPSM